MTVDTSLPGLLDIVGRGTDLYLIKTDGSGNFLWNMTYGDDIGAHAGERMQSSRPADGGYLVAGYTWTTVTLTVGSSS